MVASTEIIPVPQQPLNVAVDVAQNIKRRLGQKTPKEYRQSRPGPYDSRSGQRKRLIYAPWGYTARVLNQTFGPAWSFEYDLATDVQRIPLPDLPEKKPRGREEGRPATQREEVMVTGTLTTPFGKQVGTASHTYYPNNDQILYGDVVQAAASKALRRAGARLGIALDLYLNDDAEGLNNAEASNTNLIAFQAACAEHGLTVPSAITLLSTHLTGDAEALGSVDDVIEALGGGTVDGALHEAVAKAGAIEPAVVPDAVEPPPLGRTGHVIPISRRLPDKRQGP